jgi:hypothetical protein
MADDLPTVADAAGYEALPYGTRYKDPTGNARVKSYRVTDPASYDRVPEGAKFVDPTGAMREKRVSENIPVGAQTLYDMAWDDQTRQNVLAKAYPGGKVAKDAQGYYVEHEGKRYRASAGGPVLTETAPMFEWAVKALGLDDTLGVKPSGRYPAAKAPLTRIAATAGAEAAPTILSTLGAIGGGAGGGALAGPAGAAGGGVAGAAAGGAAGAAINDFILQEAGVYGAPKGAQTPRLMQEAALAGAGAVAGGLAGRAVSAAGAGLAADSFTAAAKRFGGAEFDQAAEPVRKFFGFTPEVEKRVGEFTAAGLKPPPKIGMPGAPYMNFVYNVMKQFGGDPVGEAAEKRYAKQVADSLGLQGVGKTEIEQVLDPAKKAAVSFSPAGTSLHAEYQAKLAAVNDRITKTFAGLEADARRAATEQTSASAAAKASRLKEAQKVLSDAREALEGYTASGFNLLKNNAEMLRGGTPRNRLFVDAGEAIRSQYAELQRNFNELYNRTYQMAGEAKVPVVFQKSLAKKIVDAMPPEVKNDVPPTMLALADTEGSALLSLEQAQKLRTWLRRPANWQLISSDVRNGQMKQAAILIDEALHAPGLAPEMRTAVEALDETDTMYRNLVVPYKHPDVQAVIDGMAEGTAPDPAKLAEALLKPHSAEFRSFMRSTVGPDIWNATLAVQLDTMLKDSATSIPGLYDTGKFLTRFLNIQRNGVLDEFPKESADLMRRQAQRIEALATKGEGLTFRATKDDTLKTLMAKADAAAAEVKRVAGEKPLDILSQELARLKAARGKIESEVESERAKSLIHPLFKDAAPLVGEAAKRVWNKPDLLDAALKQFAGDSEGIKLLRQAAVRDFFSDHNIGSIAAAWGKLEPIQQQFITYGGSAAEAGKFFSLLQEVVDATGGGWGEGIAATQALSTGNVPVIGPILKKVVPKGIMGGVGRTVAEFVAPYMQDFLSEGAYKWLARSAAGSPEEREAARRVMSKWILASMAAGAAAGGAADGR